MLNSIQKEQKHICVVFAVIVSYFNVIDESLVSYKQYPLAAVTLNQPTQKWTRNQPLTHPSFNFIINPYNIILSQMLNSLLNTYSILECTCICMNPEFTKTHLFTVQLDCPIVNDFKLLFISSYAIFPLKIILQFLIAMLAIILFLTGILIAC